MHATSSLVHTMKLNKAVWLLVFPSPPQPRQKSNCMGENLIAGPLLSVRDRPPTRPRRHKQRMMHGCRSWQPRKGFVVHVYELLESRMHLHPIPMILRQTRDVSFSVFSWTLAGQRHRRSWQSIWPLPQHVFALDRTGISRKSSRHAMLSRSSEA